MDYVHVLVAAIASFVFGWAWYSKTLFGKQWMSWSGVKPKKDMMAVSVIGGLISQVVITWGLAWLIDALKVVGWMAGMRLATMAWLAFVATFTLGSYLWEGKPFKLWVLNNAQNLLSMWLIAAILTLWV